ncbi:MAG: tetratricopeptide repeat protein [Planctomycetes bacterium]|nr:tetratricopeptide repeat protein [Planctomycetota bacterium]
MKSIKMTLGVVAVLYALWTPTAAGMTRAQARAFKQAKWLTTEELEANPAGFLGQNVAFEAFFAQMGDVYRPFYTPFIREFYVNFWVWSPSARLWEANERAQAFFFCFVERENTSALRSIQSLHRFEAVQVLAKVEIVSDGHAWLKVLHVVPSDMPTYSDKAIKHIELGMRQLREHSDYAFAAKQFETALSEKLPREAEKLVFRQAGVAYFEKKEYAKAEYFLGKALQLASIKDPMLNLRLGQSLLLVAEKSAPGSDRKGKLNGAVQQLELAINYEPNLVDAHAALGLAYGLLSDYTKGLDACRTALKLAPQHAPAFRNIAVILHLKNDTEGAILNYQKAILAKANEPTYHRELADIYMEAGRYADAEIEYNNFVTLDEDNTEAYWLRGQARLAQGNVDDAITDFEDSIKKPPDYYKSHVSVIKAYLQKRSYDKAMKAAQNATIIWKQDLDLRILQADILKVTNKFDEAATALEAAVKLDPADRQIRYEWAKILAEKPAPDVPRAIQELESIIRTSPDMMPARSLAGRLYVNQQNPSKALAHLNHYLKSNPEDVVALINQGAAYSQLAQLSRAVQSFDKALNIDPTNPYAASNKAMALCLLGKDKEAALALAEMAVDAQPGNVAFAGTLALAQALNTQHKSAKATASKALAQQKSVEGLYALGLAEFGLDNIDAAAENAEAALNLAKQNKSPTRDFNMLVGKVRELDTQVKRSLRERARELDRARREADRRGRMAPGPGSTDIPLAPVITD